MHANLADLSDAADWLDDPYDVVVIGSGLTAVSFVHKLTSLGRTKRILVLEAGSVISDRHFQQDDERTAWDRFKAAADHDIGRGVPSLVPHRVLFGGRTMFWTAWTPRPSRHELDRWPPDLASALEREFDEVDSFLGGERGPDAALHGIEKGSFPGVQVPGYTFQPASIARKQGRKFSAPDAWRAVFERTPPGSVRVVCGARVSELIAREKRVIGVRVGDAERVFPEAQFVLCASALENFRLSRKTHADTLRFACHGVVSHTVVGRLAAAVDRRPMTRALLARPDGERTRFDHHFQICQTLLPPGWTPEDLHRDSPDALELSPTLLRQHPGIDFACSITCLFEFPVPRSDGVPHEVFLGASPSERGLRDPDGFVDALSAEFASFETRTEQFARDFLTSDAAELTDRAVATTAKYVVHDTLVRKDIGYRGIKAWRRLSPTDLGEAFSLGQLNWPSVGVSNPAILNVATAFALARELA